MFAFLFVILFAAEVQFHNFEECVKIRQLLSVNLMNEHQWDFQLAKFALFQMMIVSEGTVMSH